MVLWISESIRPMWNICIFRYVRLQVCFVEKKFKTECKTCMTTVNVLMRHLLFNANFILNRPKYEGNSLSKTFK